MKWAPINESIPMSFKQCYRQRTLNETLDFNLYSITVNLCKVKQKFKCVFKWSTQ